MNQTTSTPSLLVINTLGSLLALALAFLGFVAYTAWAEDSAISEYDLWGCNVVGIDLRGTLDTYNPGEAYDLTSSEDVQMILEAAKEEEGIKALLVQVDSAGGYPVAGEEIARAIEDFGKPSVAFVRSMAGSAAYWAILPSTVIIASEVSDVGSIGATASYLDHAIENEESGLTYNQLSTGEFKDLGDPDKPLTEAERALVQRDLDLIRDAFARAVSTYRDIPLEKVMELADGSSMLGVAAREAGLIDQVGGRTEAWAKLTEMAGEEPEICWPQYQ